MGAWRTEAPELPGTAIALALETAAEVASDQERQRSTIVVSGPTTDAVPVRLTREVAIDVIRAARSSVLLVSFAAYGVAEIVSELAAAGRRGVTIDLVLETTVEEGGTLTAGTTSAAVFRELEGTARFWHWPRHNRPVVGGSRAALDAKVIAADESMALLGSANLTDRALAYNIEVGVVLREDDAVRRLVLKVPPSSAWGARTQTITVLGSTDGSGYSTVVGSAGYRFDPATGNTATVSLPASTNLRYLRLSVSANTGWPAGQFSEVEAYLTS